LLTLLQLFQRFSSALVASDTEQLFLMNTDQQHSSLRAASYVLLSNESGFASFRPPCI
jgi:hypothetical protein